MTQAYSSVDACITVLVVSFIRHTAFFVDILGTHVYVVRVGEGAIGGCHA